MNNTAFWKKDWFLALVIAAFFALSLSSSWLQSIERLAYDVGLRATAGEPNKKVAVIAIDDESLANIGRWPWPRNLHANMVDLLSEAGAKTIGYTAFFFEPQEDPGLNALRTVSDYFDSSGLTRERTSKDGVNYVVPGKTILDLRRTMRRVPANYRSEFAGSIDQVQKPLVQMQTELKAAISQLDADEALNQSMLKANNVLLPLFMHLGNQLGKPDSELPVHITKHRLTNISDKIGAKDSELLPLNSVGLELPIENSLKPVWGWAT